MCSCKPPERYLLRAKEKTCKIPGGYLMAVSKLELENSGGDFEAFLKGSTYLTTQASFLPAYCGLPLSFGQALIEIPTLEPQKPALAIHKIIPGQTFAQFYEQHEAARNNSLW